jgi:PAS domain S-box-containing protein
MSYDSGSTSEGLLISERRSQALKIRVLVVDDDEDLLFLAEKFLSKADKDFQLVSAQTDQEALRLLEEEDFDAIVCDHYLGPESMTGLDLLEWVRNANRNIPFIIFTGRSEESVAIRALNMGADYYLKKETDEFRKLFNQLSDKIHDAVEARRAEERAEKDHHELERRVDQRTRELKAANLQLETEVEERKRMEDILLLQRDLGNTLCRAHDRADAVEQILRTILQIETIDSGAIYLRNQVGGRLELAISHQMPTDFSGNLLELKVAGGQAKPAYLSSSEISAKVPQWGTPRAPSAMAIVPVNIDDLTAGVIMAGSHTSESIHSRSRHSLEAIGVQASSYLAREMAMTAIVNSQAELMNVFDSLNDALFIVDREWRILGANGAAQRMVGRDEKNINGLDALTLYNLDTSHFAEQALERVQSGRLFEMDVPIKSPDGTTTNTSTRVLRGSHGGQDVMFIISRPLREPIA